MAHERLRRFNTKDTYPEQNLDNDLCQVVKAGNMVFLRGQVGQDLATRESVGIGDAAAQAEQAMKNVKLLLEEAGGYVARLDGSDYEPWSDRTGLILAADASVVPQRASMNHPVVSGPA